MLSDSVGIRNFAVNSFSDLYATELLCPPETQLPLEDLPRISALDVDRFEQDLMHSESILALNDFTPRKTAGIDGLPPEFYKAS